MQHTPALWSFWLWIILSWVWATFSSSSWTLFSDQGDRFPFHYFTCSNKSCPLLHMTAPLLLRLGTPRHYFSVCGMDGTIGCRKKGEGRAWGRDPSGLPAGNPRHVVRKLPARQPLEVAKIPSRRDRQRWLPLRRLLLAPEGLILLIKFYNHSPCHAHCLWPTTNSEFYFLCLSIPLAMEPVYPKWMFYTSSS